VHDLRIFILCYPAHDLRWPLDGEEWDYQLVIPFRQRTRWRGRDRGVVESWNRRLVESQTRGINRLVRRGKEGEGEAEGGWRMAKGIRFIVLYEGEGR